MYRESPESSDDRQYYQYHLDRNGSNLNQNTMAQTAMQELIQRLKESAKSYKEAGEDLYAAALLNSTILAMHLLEKEKQQIINSHLTGLIMPLETEASKQAEQYYQENYGGTI